MPLNRRTVLSAALSMPLASRTGYAWDRRPILNAMVSIEPATLNYPLLNVRQSQQICGSINKSLLRFDWQFRPCPNLATRFTVSPDGLVYTFYLQENVLWHDGVPFTANDVVFSSDVMLRQLSARSRVALDRCKSITALDKYTVEYRLNAPFNAFLFSFMGSTGPMMPAHIYEGTNFLTNPYNFKPIGTGPFKFHKWSRGEFIHLVRNNHYWRPGRPLLEEIYYRIVPTTDLRMVALESGAIDLAFGQDIDPVVMSRLRKNPMLRSIDNAYDGDGEIVVMEINQRKAPFADRRFRAALMHAIDREFLVNAVNFGMGKVAQGPIPSTAPYFDENALVIYPFDPDRARALLNEMGLKPDANGVRARLRMLSLADGGGAVDRGAQYTKQALAAIGLQIDLQVADWPNFNQHESNWDYDLAWNSYGIYGDPAIGTSRLYLSSNIRKGVPATNLQGYVNPEIDMLFSKAANALAHGEAQRYYSRIQNILTRDVAMLWMYERKSVIFHNRRLHNLVTGPNGPCDGFGEAFIA